MVAHDHERARPEARIEPARCVREDHDPGTEPLEQQHGLDDQPGVVALVQVEAALEHDHDAAAETPDAGGGRRGPAPSRPASRGAPRTGWRPGPRPRRRGRPGPSPGRSRPRARDPSCAGRPRPARPGAPAARSAGWGATGRPDGSGQGCRSRGTSGLQHASIVDGRSRELRRPDERIDTGMPITSRRAGHVARRGETAAVAAMKRPKRPAAERGSLDVISDPSVLSAPSGKTYGRRRPVDGSTRLSTKSAPGPPGPSTSCPRLWTACGEGRRRAVDRSERPVSRPSRTSRSWADRGSPPSAARSSGHRVAARSRRPRRSGPRRTSPSGAARAGRARRRRTGRCRAGPRPRSARACSRGRRAG